MEVGAERSDRRWQRAADRRVFRAADRETRPYFKSVLYCSVDVVDDGWGTGSREPRA